MDLQIVLIVQEFLSRQKNLGGLSFGLIRLRREPSPS
jgi:hypothetical protein